ncbi:hypothetical protein AVEN_229668-1 [Araneus ventricosus]|uniref:Uncharacterized protein n=1 Tax=Araneus ventricosus TaxID=182803 RepID=A0A4Y2LB66_ARAVE|nr:hypothetical protein AVEN_229668-1 [Araneus ventricosus]
MNARVVGVVGPLCLLPRRPVAGAGGEPVQDEFPEVLRHLLSAGTTVVEVEDHHRDYDRNGRDSHHHRQLTKSLLKTSTQIKKSSCNLRECVSDSSTKDGSLNVDGIAEGCEANMERLQCASGLNIDVDRIESISESSETDIEAILE